MKFSLNKITQRQYPLPESLDDLNNINEFLSLHKNKKVVVVQGLGFVGAVMSIVCANALGEEYAVIGIDLPNEDSYWKIRSINEGVFPLNADDNKISEYFERARKKGNLYATFDSRVFGLADIIIVDINLDVIKKSNDLGVLRNFDVDLSSFDSAITEIGKFCREDAIILVETTVPPGTSQSVVKPIIDKELLKRNMSIENYRLGHSYERVMPGPNYIDSIISYPRVYSGINENSADVIESFLKTIIDTSKCDLTRLENTNASEMAKVLENSYRAMNISFMVEWSRFAEEAGVDLYSVIDAIRVRETHKNIMFPGIGVGGYCLTKDPLLASWSRTSIFNSDNQLDMSIKSVSNNDQMPVFAFERLKNIYGDLKNKKIVLLGVSYRGNVGDTRYSPVEKFYNLLKKSGAVIYLHDPFISYWEEKNITVSSELNQAIESEPDIIVISAGHDIYKNENTIEKIMNLNPLTIFDTIGHLNKEQLKLLKVKHKISVLGRGDLK